MSGESNFAADVARITSGQGGPGAYKLFLWEAADELPGFRAGLSMQGVVGGEDIGHGVNLSPSVGSSSGVTQLDPFG